MSAANDASPSVKIPNADKAVIPREKIMDYLLNPNHPIGRSKALFFLRYGFSVQAWEMLSDALMRHVVENEVRNAGTTPYGTRYELHGPLQAPDGTVLNVLTAWYIDSGKDVPRLVTAYPLPKTNHDKGI